MPNSEAQRKFELDVMAFLVNRNQHYTVVKTKGFQHFYSVTNQKYNVKSPCNTSKRIAPLLHKNLEKAVHEVLEKKLPDLTATMWPTHLLIGIDIKVKRKRKS